MPSLTHICIFSEHGWKRITVDEATKIEADLGLGVSARGGLFMCELCGQYVTLTKEGKNTRHFRHHAKEADKSCPERTFGAASTTNCDRTKHDLPIRLKLFPKNIPSDFELELGLLAVPQSTINALQNQKILIVPTKQREAVYLSYSYVLKERLSEEKITYVSIGQIPFPEYQIKMDSRKDILGFFCWPERIQGINPSGTLFDTVSCKKLPYDADVQVGKDYYLLCTKQIFNIYSSVSLKQILIKRILGINWFLYKVSASIIDKYAANFFLQYHCRLTDQPIAIQPIWPIYSKSPYVIHHNSQEMIFHVRGNVTTKCFPHGACKCEHLTDGGRLEYIQCSARQQLISAGHSYKLNGGDLWRRLKYTYLWQEPLDRTKEIPSISVTDFSGQTVYPGRTNKLPPQNILRICTPYDGLVILKQKGRVIEKRRLRADTTVEFGSIQFGFELEMLQGLDCVWSIQYQQAGVQLKHDEAQLLLRLKNAVGPLVAIPHTWGATAGRLDSYPQIKRWLYQKIREGSMPMSAYRELKHFMICLAMN